MYGIVLLFVRIEKERKITKMKRLKALPSFACSNISLSLVRAWEKWLIFSLCLAKKCVGRVRHGKKSQRKKSPTKYFFSYLRVYEVFILLVGSGRAGHTNYQSQYRNDGSFARLGSDCAIFVRRLHTMGKRQSSNQLISLIEACACCI